MIALEKPLDCFARLTCLCLRIIPHPRIWHLPWDCACVNSGPLGRYRCSSACEWRPITLTHTHYGLFAWRVELLADGQSSNCHHTKRTDYFFFMILVTARAIFTSESKNTKRKKKQKNSTIWNPAESRGVRIDILLINLIIWSGRAVFFPASKQLHLLIFIYSEN